MVIQVSSLTKRYGTATAVDDLTFEVRSGAVTGFLGPNGAGKSTTMRMVLGLDEPSAGTALVDGQPYRDLRAAMCVIGALLDAAAMHPARTGRAHLKVAARSNGIPLSRVDAVIEQVGLGSAARRRVKGYSLGMRQRLGIAVGSVVRGGCVAMWSVWSGTHRGEFMGIPATGRTVAVEAWTMDTLRDGRLVQSRILMDAMGMLTQLGALPAPDAPAAG